MSFLCQLAWHAILYLQFFTSIASGLLSTCPRTLGLWSTRTRSNARSARGWVRRGTSTCPRVSPSSCPPARSVGRRPRGYIMGSTLVRPARWEFRDSQFCMSDWNISVLHVLVHFFIRLPGYLNWTLTSLSEFYLYLLSKL